ncbi:MAG: TrmH family RNA methyltransferase [Phycisphaeraceae bacterium JB051]
MPDMLITSPNNPRIKAVAKLLQSRQRRKSGMFLVERDREITRALASGFRLTEFYWCPRLWPQEWSPREVFDLGDIPVIEVADSVLTKMTVSQNPQGVLAVFEQRAIGAEQLFTKDSNGLWLVTVGIEKPGNLGAMARTAESAGCTGMLVCTPDGTADADLYNPNAIRASTGAVFSLPMACMNESDAIGMLRKNGVQIVTTSDRAQTSWDKVDYAQPTAIVIGPEDTGLSQMWLEAGDGLLPVSIPMRGENCDSLNASVAAGILLYEAVRQRQ